MIESKTPTTFTADQKEMATIWFRNLRDSICSEFEAIETELTATPHKDSPAGTFSQKIWHRTNDDGSSGGGGEMSVMRGRVFEKVGVNISVVNGTFPKNFQANIPGAEESGGQFWAAGISLVSHMQSPLVPAAHMNTRMIVTSKGWFGGGSDLTPIYPNAEDTNRFHSALKDTCDRHNPAYYEEFKTWCDRYFFLPHRNEPRGIGGIFFDYINTGKWDNDFSFVQDVGTTFRDTYAALVRAHMNKEWTPEQREHQLVRRGRYVEFNLLHDRGTQFGLKTGGDTEAILMSMPPEVKWP